MLTNFVLNAEGGTGPVGHGPIGSVMGQFRFEPHFLRPFVLRDQRTQCVMVHNGKYAFDAKANEDRPVYEPFRTEDIRRMVPEMPVVANASTLTVEAWRKIDEAVVRANRPRLRAWTDLASRSRVSGINGMGIMTWNYQAMTDAGEAQKSMYASANGRRDRPLFNLKSVPLPITYSEFFFDEREIAVSRNTGSPLDLTMVEQAGYQVGLLVEDTLVGIQTGVTFGTVSTGPAAITGSSTEYGYTNYPYRVTKTDLHTPSTSTPENVVEDFLEMVETMKTNGFYGPYLAYYSTPYDRYLKDDYFRTGGTSVNRSLRARIMDDPDIIDMRRLDRLTSGYQIILIQPTSEVAQAIIGMDLTTVQWPSQGGLGQNFKVMCIHVPVLKSPYNGVSGIVHGTTS